MDTDMTTLFLVLSGPSRKRIKAREDCFCFITGGESAVGRKCKRYKQQTKTHVNNKTMIYSRTTVFVTYLMESTFSIADKLHNNIYWQLTVF